MPTSAQNLKLLKDFLANLDDAQLSKVAHDHSTRPPGDRLQWEVPSVDAWAARDLQSLSKVKSELESLSLPGLERLKEHFQQRLQLVENEQRRRRRKKGHPSKPDVWILACIYFELISRGLKSDAEQFRKKLVVSVKTLGRYRNDPHRDER
jgi:hypothetical protein